MSNQERNSLIFRLEDLEQHQQVLAKYIAVLKRQLDSLREQINNHTEIQQLASLEAALAHLSQQLDERSALSVAPEEVFKESIEQSNCPEESQLQSTQIQIL